ncbi:MAG: GerMN domain-containing protein [Sedimentisphaerales bacterium]|nr:GerMN domain-containing protein [Sedimentisphaerales bacterium]
MNTESTAIVALIIVIVLGFLAFVFFTDGNEQTEGTSGETSSDQVWTDEIKSNEINPGEVTPSKTNSSEVKSGTVSPDAVSSNKVLPSEIKSGAEKPVETKTNIVKPDEVKPVEVQPEEVKSGFINRSLEDLIQVYTPLANQEISSPLIIEGKARGFWFFEADFPVMLTDSKGEIIVRGTAAAKSDWMTENFVAFSAELKFTPDYGKSGVLILRNDNPSDLQENNREIRIPVLFGEQETITVLVFFSNTRLDPSFSGEKAFPTPRVIPKTQAVARAALEELLKGPTEQEKEAGFFTSINTGVKIQKLSVINGIARVDFDKQLDFQVGGSARVRAIRAEIIQTLMQFSTVNQVIISIDGRTQDILQP